MKLPDGVEAFGPQAQRYAARLPAGIPAIVSDGTDPARALVAAAKRRREGRPFFTSIVADDPRAAIALQLGGQIYAHWTTYDERRQAFDKLASGTLNVNGRLVRDLQPTDPRALQTHRTFLLMGDALLARSETERRRVEYAVAREREPGRTREHVALFPGEDAAVPHFAASSKGDAIVVWAPDVSAAATASIVFALEELKIPVYVVCADGQLSASRAFFVRPDAGDVATLLTRAQVIVDAAITDPSAAIALAAGGAPLCVASTSGAHEYLDGVSRYEPTHWETVLAAVSKARAGSVPRIRASAGAIEMQGVLAAAAAPSVIEGPLVSIVIATFNRPQYVEAALRCVERQQYSNFEVLVVNDGGLPLDEIVSRFPRARLIDLPQNVGVSAAFNAGVQAARGEYILDLADDDMVYPDCLSRIVSALLRTGASIGHGNLIQRFDEPAGDGGYRTYGYYSQYDVANDPTTTLSGMTVLNTSALVHRRVFDLIGGYATDVTGNDYDFQIHAAQHFEYVHIDWFVGEMAVRNDKTSTSGRADIAEAVREIYAKYPISGRPYVEIRRQALLDEVTRRQGQETFWEPELRV